MTQRTSNPFGSIGSIIMLALVFILLYYLVSGIFWILSWVAPVLLLITLVIDHKVVTDFGKWTINLFSKNWLYALGTIGVLAALSFIGGPNLITGVIFPTIASFLFGKAIFKRKFKQLADRVQNQTSGPVQDVEYEDLTEDADFEDVTPLELPETLDLEEIPPKKPIQETRGKDGNNYDNFFE